MKLILDIENRDSKVHFLRINFESRTLLYVNFMDDCDFQDFVLYSEANNIITLEPKEKKTVFQMEINKSFNFVDFETCILYDNDSMGVFGLSMDNKEMECCINECNFILRKTK